MGKQKKKGVERKEKKVFLELFYMTPEVVSAKGLSDFFKDWEEILVDFWEEMEVFEIGMVGLEPVSFEQGGMEFQHPKDQAFLKNRGIKSIFHVTAEKKAFEDMRAYLEKMVEEFGGFICSDSEDFQPFYMGIQGV